MKKILIIGANGFVGNYLVNEFASNNYKVVACDLSSNDNKRELVEYEKLDILEKDEVFKIIEKHKPDYLINLAAISSVGASWGIPQKTIEINVCGTINILESIKESCPKCKVLLIGSSEEYAISDKPINEKYKLDATNPYGVSKMAQEKFANIYRENYGLNIVCTRSFNHTGIGQNDNFVIPSFCKQVADIENGKSEPKIYVGNLGVYRDISDVRDVVKTYRMIIESDKNEFVYNVGSGKSYKLEDLLRYIISLSNKKIEICIDKNKFRPSDNEYICCDNKKIKKWFNNTDIKETIKEMFEYYKNR